MKEIEELLDNAIRASDKGDVEAAIEIYKKILTIKEDWSTPNYNLGLIYKYKNDWEKSFQFNMRATELNPNDESALWNLGIAATMLEKWKIARKA
jgi:tetratricopeptide (TPR) repeat protein